MTRDTAYYTVDVLCLILSIISFVIVGTQVDWDAYIWRFYVGFGCFMAFCIVVAEVNINKFASMTIFPSMAIHINRFIFVLALIDFIILELSDVPDDCVWDDPDQNENCPILNPDESYCIIHKL